MATNTNSYLPMVHRNLPRLLALYNTDKTHPLCGCGDRRYWGWKLSDFPNGTFQGAALGLARLIVAKMLPDWIDEKAAVQRAVQMIAVVPELTDDNGALGEALPNEGSFCVTGLVLGDSLGAIQLLDRKIPDDRREQLITGLEPLAQFLKSHDETHGIISNHLATSALSMVRWMKMKGDAAAMERAEGWIARIREHASEEGWMREYGGADPGYQSWCTSSLAQIHDEAPELDVSALLEKSFSFMEAFAFSDGSFANGCGSRLTRFFMAGGAELWTEKSPAAARLARFARTHSAANRHVTLDSIDEPNIVPFFNDAALAATLGGHTIADDLPRIEQCDFPEAGLLMRNRHGGRLIINTNRCGWLALSGQGLATRINAEPAARAGNGAVLRPVRGSVTLDDGETFIIEGDLEPVERMLPSPFKFIILRALSLTVFRFPALGNRVKQVLARVLISEKHRSCGRVRRRIDLTSGAHTDEIIDGDAQLIKDTKGFSPLHMASQGYWQVSDDTTLES